MKKTIALLVIAVFAITACAPKAQANESAVLPTQTAWIAAVTNTPFQPSTATPVVVQTAEARCTAQELGPWAPNNGLGETFEVTANEAVSSGVHVQLWWPAGSGEAWGKEEISTFLPPGLSVEVQDGAGRGWEYPLGCSLSEIRSQMDADHARRTTDTSYWGVVEIDDLIATGLVTVRFDRR